MSTQDVRMTRQAMRPAARADMVNIVPANAMKLFNCLFKDGSNNFLSITDALQRRHGEHDDAHHRGPRFDVK